MNCRQCQGIESFFNKRFAIRELKTYRKKGPGKTARMLIEALEAESIEGMSLLDIGGGIGAIQHALLGAKAGHATNVEASMAYLEAAREEAERQGFAHRVRYHHSNFVDLAQDIAPADIVMLDRVICCYPDMPSLVGLSAARAQKWYGVVYPRDTWWMQILRPLINFFFLVQRNPFRFFLHPSREIDAVVRGEGLEPRFSRKTLLWQMVMYAH